MDEIPKEMPDADKRKGQGGAPELKTILMQ